MAKRLTKIHKTTMNYYFGIRFLIKATTLGSLSEGKSKKHQLHRNLTGENVFWDHRPN